MSKLKTILAATIAAAGLITFSSSIYTIDETEQAVVTQMGKAKKIVVGSQTPGQPNDSLAYLLDSVYAARGFDVDVVSRTGIHFKTPFVQSVQKFEDRIMEYDSKPSTVITKDKKSLVIDNYARWIIEDPLKFMNTVRSERGAQSQLDDIIYAAVKQYAGKNNLIELVRSTNNMLDEVPDSTSTEVYDKISVGRQIIMGEITDLCNDLTREKYGIRILDVQIKRAEYLPENKEAVYKDMIQERKRIAQQYESEGEEIKRVMNAQTDREVETITSEGYATAEQINGQGDREATRIYAKAYNVDPKFYSFWRSLEAYKTAYSSGTKMFMTTDSKFNRYLKDAK